MLTEFVPPDVLVWLLRSLIVATAWFGLGGLLLCLTREPVRRTLLCTLSLGGGLLIPLVCLVLGDGGWTLGATLPLPTEIIVTRGGPIASARGDFKENPVLGARSSLVSGLANPAAVEPRPPETEDGDAPGSRVSFTSPAVSNTPALRPRSAIPNDVTPANLLRPGTSESAAPDPSWHPSLMVVGYALGMSACLGWYLVGLLGVWMLVRKAGRPASELQQLWNEVRGPDLQRVPLLVSSRVTQPIACWGRGPCVLLPAAWETAAGDRLRWALVHEAEHVRRGDFWTWQLANVARCVYWCHPLAWWLRNELRQAQDYVADGAAARLDATASSPAVVEYAEFLTVSARSRVGGSSLVGLGLFGRRSDLYRRIAMLLKREGAIERRAPKWWKVACITWGLGLFVTLTTMRVVATPETGQVETRKPGNSVIALPTSDRTLPMGSGVQALAPAGTADPSWTSHPRFDPFPQTGMGPLLAGGPGVPASRTADPSVSFTPSGVRKLEITDGFVEPEPGVFLGKAIIHDAQGGPGWGMDGNAPPVGGEELVAEGGGYGAGGADGMSMMAGGYPGAMGIPGMGGMGSGVAPIPPLPENHRTRTIALFVRRPGPTGISTSIDGQTAWTNSDQLAEPKVRRFQHAGYWPQDQVVGSLGVRYASSAVKRVITSTNKGGETFPFDELSSDVQGADRLAVLGEWWGGNDLSTRIPFEHASPPGMPFVIRVEATDQEGQRHAGRIEHRPREMRSEGSYSGAGPSYGPSAFGGEGSPKPEIVPESWTIVFAHLPPSRIKSVRIAWHPYAWVIFRNVSLEAGHETTPTAELYLDDTAPPAMAATIPVSREADRFTEQMEFMIPIPDSKKSLVKAGELISVYCKFRENDDMASAHLIDVPVVQYNTNKDGSAWIMVRLGPDEAPHFKMAMTETLLDIMPVDPKATKRSQLIQGDTLNRIYQASREKNAVPTVDAPADPAADTPK